jgi:hypothetical protein
METPAFSGSTQRRSVRVLVTIPLILSGRRADGTRFEDTAETIIVNKHGAKIRTQEELTCGLQIRIAILSPYRFQMARVVRQEAEGEFSIELEQAENFWRVYFPPEDWGLEENQISGSPPETSAPGPPSNSSQTTPNETAKTSTRGTSSSTLEGSPRLSRNGSPAIIRGMAATHVPFQEKGVLVPVDPDRATISVMPLVEPGARVKVILLPHEDVVNAVVSGLSRVRVNGKWRLTVKFGVSIELVGEAEQPKQ